MAGQFEIDRARRETPACEDVIHFNNAGSALMPQPVSEALFHYLETEVRMGGYESADYFAAGLNGLYDSAASLLNCSPKEIAFVENATRAWELAFYAFHFKPGDRILTSIYDYGSNVIAYLQQAERYDVEVVFVPNDEFGQISIDALKNLIDDRVKLISISHIPTGGGLVNPAAAVGKIANDAGIPFLLDTCQSAGQIPLDVQTIGCDALCITGRKFLRGPRATGLLYIRESMMDQLTPPTLDQHAADLVAPDRYVMREDAKRFENWEQNFSGKYALKVAIDYALDWGLDNIQQRVYSLADLLRHHLRAIDGISITDEGQEQCGIVTFVSDSKSARQIKEGLTGQGVNVSVSGGSGTLVSFQQRGLTDVVRASVHYYNTEQEVDIFIDRLKTVLRS